MYVVVPITLNPSTFWCCTAADFSPGLDLDNVFPQDNNDHQLSQKECLQPTQTTTGGYAYESCLSPGPVSFSKCLASPSAHILFECLPKAHATANPRLRQYGLSV